MGKRHTVEYIKRGTYHPMLHSDVEKDQNATRTWLASALKQGILNVPIVQDANTEQAPEQALTDFRPSNSKFYERQTTHFTVLIGGRGWNRTSNLSIKSRMLCQLSYASVHMANGKAGEAWCQWVNSSKYSMVGVCAAMHYELLYATGDA